MKKGRTIFVAGLCLSAIVVGIFLAASSPATPPSVPVFLGFTNGARGAEAMFAISNPPSVRPGYFSMNHHGGVYWVSEGLWTHSRHLTSRPQTRGRLVCIPVEKTNEPLRFVFEFRLPVTGFASIGNKLKQKWGRLTGRQVSIDWGEPFRVTNEVGSAFPPVSGVAPPQRAGAM